MARRNPAQLQFDALSLEGALLPPEWLARVAALEAPAQSPADYGVPKGLQLRDEIGRYWRIAEAIWAEFAAARSGAEPVGASSRLTRDLLVQVFGFSDLVVVGERTIGGRVFPLAFEALGGRVPVVVGSPSEGMDQSVPRHGDGARRRSAWGGLQEYLNAADGALWGIATNGNTLRVGRDNSSMTRPAWLEMDLERIFTEERFADFSVLWLLLHASRFGRADQLVHEAPLEQWREAGREEGSRAREALRVGVEDALRALGQGFVAHPANTELRGALASGALSPGDYFNELLRLVYRMIFLLSVEERGILHPAAPKDEEARRRHEEAVRLYEDGYGMRRLRERSVRHAAHDRHGDLWASLRPVFHALGRADGELALALPGLGGLFATDQCPHLDASALENRSLLTAIFRLAWLREGDALARVNWKDMGVEEFGSVYESLLELVPVVSDGGRRFGFAGEGESAGNARRLTGSYYTPDALVQQLLDTALEPVVAQRLAEHPTSAGAEQALLALAVLDPACGSGHFLLAAARRLAGHLARLRAGGTPGAAEYRHALRDVVTHCIHGVDRNPMALELARMALWLEAYTPDCALGFLDHHLVCGDALLGLLDLNAVKGGIPDEAFKALTGDDKDVAKLLTKLNRAGRKVLEEREKRGQLALSLGTQSLADAFLQLDALPDEGFEGVEAKRARYAALREEAAASTLALAADLYVGALLMPKTLAPGERTLTEQGAVGRFPTTSTLEMALDGTLPWPHPVAVAARATCVEARALHWSLAFPQVFSRRGFDVVLGNPPWERMKLEEREWFSTRAPDIATARNTAERGRAIARLADENPRLLDEYQSAVRVNEAAAQFARASGRYPLCGHGDVNTYSLFTETASMVVRPQGRIGFVVPSGIATDETTATFFFNQLESGRLVSLYEFENRERLFPAVAPVQRFALLTMQGEGASGATADFIFNATRIAHLVEQDRRCVLSAADVERINPNSHTCPVFRSRKDADIARRIYSNNPILVREGSPEGNAWRVVYRSMFHASGASELFRTKEQLEADGYQLKRAHFVKGASHYVPVVEGKLFHLYNHRFNTYDGVPLAQRFQVKAPAASMSAAWNDPTAEPLPRYWVTAEDAADRWIGHRRWSLAMRDIVRPESDRRVAVFAAMPFAAHNHVAPNLFLPDNDPASPALLLSILSSLPLEYAARLSIGGAHFSLFTLKQMPTLAPAVFDQQAFWLGAETLRQWVLPRVVELSYTSWSMRPLAADCGLDGSPFRWDDERRYVMQRELDALMFVLFGFDEESIRYALSSLRIFRDQEQARFGEFRAEKMVLGFFSAMTIARATGRPFRSALTPAPADSTQRHAERGEPESPADTC